MIPAYNQNRAGVFVGQQHSERGIPLALIDSGTHIEVEGGEFNFPEWVQNDKKIYKFTGTNYKVLQELFKLVGASWDEKVTHVKSGDIIICIRSAFDDETRTYEGTIVQILSAINESCGCKHVESGATMTNHETGEIKEMLAGGKIPFKETIDDSHYTFIKEIKDIEVGKRYFLEDIIKHEKLVKRFPDFKKIIVIFEDILDDDVKAFAEADFNINIKINVGFHFSYYKKHNHEKYKLGKTEYPERSKEGVLLHEIQHVCQFKNRRSIGQGYDKAIDASCAENSCQNEPDAIKKGLWIKVQNEAILAYKSQPAEQEAMWAVDVWLKKIGLNYGNRQYFLFDDKFKDIQHGSQDGIYMGGGKLPELNDEGGYEYKNKDEKVAERCGLITLPKSIAGTNCSNCIFQKDGFCDHEKILLPVTKRMCCAMWSDKSIGSAISNITKADFFPDKKLTEKKYPLNENGGYDYIGSGLKRAQAVDLITLPKQIKGTSCAFKNCLYADSNNFCTHPKIMLPVTDRMSCGWYDSEGIIRPWGKPVEIDFSKEKKNGGELSKEAPWVLADTIIEAPELLALKNGGRIAQGFIIAPYSKLKGIFGEPNVKNNKEKIGWYMAIDKDHIGAIWTEADKSVKTIMGEKFHKWFVWGANDESQRRLYEATRSQVKDIDPEKQKEKDKAISVKRWVKKRDHITEMANNVHKIKLNVSRDLNSLDEKEFLTALVVAIMLQTSERVGNEASMESGHCGVTGFQRSQVNVIGNKVLLDYVGKSGVEQEKSFTDKKIAKAMKRAIKNSPSKYIFETSDGFKIRCDKVNKYLEKFSVTAKNIRGFNANKFIIKKLEATEIPEDPKQRKKIFNNAVKLASQSVGHGASTLKTHYMIPELMDEYVLHGRIIDMKKLGYYQQGGEVEGQQQNNEELLSIGKAENPKTPIFVSVDRYFFNKKQTPDEVHKAVDDLYQRSSITEFGIKEFIKNLPEQEIDFMDIVPVQDDLDVQKLEDYISKVNSGATFPPAFGVRYNGKVYLNDGHHRAVALYINGRPIHASIYQIGQEMSQGGNNNDFANSEKSLIFISTKITKDEIRNVLSGKSKVSYGESIKTASSYLRESKGASPLIADPELNKQYEAQLLKNYSALIPVSDLKNYIGEGTEHRVYLNDDDKTVSKLNSGYFYSSWQDYFTSLLLHNYFFPDTIYELIGFAEENEKLFSVVKQPFITSTEAIDLNRVKKFLSDNGFINIQNDDYFNRELGILLADIHEQNVIINNGLLYFIDTVFHHITSFSQYLQIAFPYLNKRVINEDMTDVLKEELNNAYLSYTKTNQ